MRYKALLVDDEQHVLEIVQIYVERYFPKIQVCGTAQSVEESKVLIKELVPDIVFLDIRLRNQTSVEMLEEMALPKETHVIFITAYEDYAVKAFEVSASGYLLKPIQVSKFKETVSRVLQGIDNKRLLEGLTEEEKVVLPGCSKYTLSSLNEILYCEADGGYTAFHLLNGQKNVVSKSLKEIEEQLPPSTFMRVHKTYLINTKHIVEFNTVESQLTLIEGNQIPVSRRKKTELKRLIEQGF